MSAVREARRPLQLIVNFGILIRDANTHPLVRGSRGFAAVVVMWLVVVQHVLIVVDVQETWE